MRMCHVPYDKSYIINMIKNKNAIDAATQTRYNGLGKMSVAFCMSKKGQENALCTRREYGNEDMRLEYLLYISIVLFSITQTSFVKLYNKNSGDVIAFNVVKALSALALFGVLCIWGMSFHGETILFACMYGASLTASMYFGFKAFACGPLSLTGMIIAFSVVIPVVYGLGFNHEELTLFKILGFVFLVGAIVLTNLGKPKTETRTNYGKWFLYVALTFLTDGICAVLQKVHQTRNPGMYSREFMLFAMLACSGLFLLVAVFRTPLKTYRTMKGRWFAVVSGLANAAANFITIVLAGSENASVMFPTISVGTILGALLCGALLFKEKLRVNHYIALACGIAAIVFLKI